MTEETYCSKHGCLEKATFEFEGNSVCDIHLVDYFKSTSLEIRCLVTRR